MWSKTIFRILSFYKINLRIMGTELWIRVFVVMVDEVSCNLFLLVEGDEKANSGAYRSKQTVQTQIILIA